MKNKCYFPMFVDLSDKRVLVIGGGTVATRRVKTLLNFTRLIKVIAPQMSPELFQLVRTGMVNGEFREAERDDFADVFMVLAATDDNRVNDDIYRICKAQGIYVNVASDHEKCDFYFPGVVRKEEAVIGITASGKNHKKARRLRQEIQKALELVEKEMDDNE